MRLSTAALLLLGCLAVTLLAEYGGAQPVRKLAVAEPTQLNEETAAETNSLGLETEIAAEAASEEVEEAADSMLGGVAPGAMTAARRHDGAVYSRRHRRGRHSHHHKHKAFDSFEKYMSRDPVEAQAEYFSTPMEAHGSDAAMANVSKEGRKPNLQQTGGSGAKAARPSSPGLLSDVFNFNNGNTQKPPPQQQQQQQQQQLKKKSKSIRQFEGLQQGSNPAPGSTKDQTDTPKPSKPKDSKRKQAQVKQGASKQNSAFDPDEYVSETDDLPLGRSSPYKQTAPKNGGSGNSGGGSGSSKGDISDSYPGSYPKFQNSNSKNVCRQVLIEEEEVEVEFDVHQDKATISTLLGTCSNPSHPLPTLGGGCVIECEDINDLRSITPLNSHSFVAPSNFKSIDNYFPVMCSYRADAALEGSCNIVMKVACCSDVPRHVGGNSDEAGEDADDAEDDDEQYYAIVKSKLLRIPLEQY